MNEIKERLEEMCEQRKCSNAQYSYKGTGTFFLLNSITIAEAKKTLAKQLLNVVMNPARQAEVKREKMKSS